MIAKSSSFGDDQGLLKEIRNDDSGAVSSRSALDAASRMSASGTKVEPIERGAVGREPRDRPCPRDLMKADAAVLDIALLQAENALQVKRRQHIAADDRAGKARGELVDDG